MPVRFAVRRPVATLMLYAGLVFFGLLAAGNLPVDFLPSVTVPTLVVSAGYTGASPEEVRQLVTIPLEDAFASLKGIQSIRSVSRRGTSTITLDFHWGTAMAFAGVQTREIIDTTFPLLPQAADRPQVLPIDPGSQPVMIIGVRSVDGDLQSARQIADRELRSALQRVEGAGSVILVGGSDREVWVEADQSRMLATGLTLDGVASFLASENVDLPAGSFTGGHTEYLVRTNGRVSSPASLAALRVPLRNGGGVEIGDFARVSWHAKEPVSLFMVDGKESVGIVVRGRPGESPVELSKRIRAELFRLSSDYRGNVEIGVVEDASETIVQSINGMLSSALLGGGGAFLVMLIFLRRLRPALILIASVPASVLFCLVLLWFTGRSINMMSLGGIALSIGMLVDDGVVVLENLERRLAVRPTGSLREAVVGAGSEVFSSILGSTLTTMVVFVPVIFLPGLIGALYADLALSVVYCLFASLIVSITLVPVLFLLTYPANPTWRGERALRASLLERGYRRSLAVGLRRPYLVIAAVGLAAAGTVALFPAVRLTFVAPYDDGRIRITIVAAPSTSMTELKRIAESVSRRILRFGEIKSVWGRAGGESDDIFSLADAALNRHTLAMTVETKYVRKPDSMPIVEALRRSIGVDNASLAVSLPASAIARLLGIQLGGDHFVVPGATPDGARAKAEALLGKIRRVLPRAEARITQTSRVPEIHLEPRRDLLARTGLSLSSVARTVFEGLHGAVPTKIVADGHDYDVRVILSESARSSVEALSSVRVRATSGELVRTGEVVKVSRAASAAMLLRRDREDAVTISVRVAGNHDGTLGDLIELERTKDGVVDETRTVFDRHRGDIFIVLGVALLLLYLLLGAQFESFVQPLIILISVPLAAVGVFGALVVSGHSLDLSSGLGGLVLLGTTVKVSIILFANFRRRIDSGAPAVFALYSGTSERLRPILISSLATVVALLPAALNLNGLSTEDGIAITVIGGLVVSAGLTLYVVPLLALAYYRIRRRSSSVPVQER